jgi:hypothetical protein
MSASREARAAARAAWPVRRYRLGEEPADDLQARTTAEERLAMVDELTRQAWELSRLPLPDYRREETPIRVLPLDAEGRASGR